MPHTTATQHLKITIPSPSTSTSPFSTPTAPTVSSISNNIVLEEALNFLRNVVDATFDHSYNRDLFPSPFILATNIQERQLASGFFTIASSGNSGNGTSNNTFTYTDDEGNTYDREVSAVDNVITADHQGGNLPPFNDGAADMSGSSASQKREAFSAGQDLVVPRFLARRGRVL